MQGSITQHAMSLLICDDRPAVSGDLAARLGRTVFGTASVDIECVCDGLALVSAFGGMAPDLVLIGVHAGSQVGIEAIARLQEEFPSAMPIIVGSSADIDLLAATFARGAGGLLLWEPQVPPGAACGPDGVG